MLRTISLSSTSVACVPPHPRDIHNFTHTSFRTDEKKLADIHNLNCSKDSHFILLIRIFFLLLHLRNFPASLQTSPTSSTIQINDIITELSTGRMDPRVGSGRVGSGRVGSGRVGSGRVGSGRVTILLDFGGSGRVGSALRIY